MSTTKTSLLMHKKEKKKQQINIILLSLDVNKSPVYHNPQLATDKADKFHSLKSKDAREGRALQDVSLTANHRPPLGPLHHNPRRSGGKQSGGAQNYHLHRNNCHIGSLSGLQFVPQVGSAGSPRLGRGREGRLTTHTPFYYGDPTA